MWTDRIWLGNVKKVFSQFVRSIVRKDRVSEPFFLNMDDPRSFLVD